MENKKKHIEAWEIDEDMSDFGCPLFNPDDASNSFKKNFLMNKIKNTKIGAIIYTTIIWIAIFVDLYLMYKYGDVVLVLTLVVAFFAIVIYCTYCFIYDRLNE